MTLTPWLWAFLMIAAPEPGSRSTRRMTLAPFVIAWSAWLACVAGSPWALTIVCLIPAAVKAWSRYLRSCVSQRTDDFVSGRSTAIEPLPLVLLDGVLLAELLLDDLLELPQPATAKARAATAAAIPTVKPGVRLIIGEPPPPGAVLGPGSFAARRAGCWHCFVRVMRRPPWWELHGVCRPTGRIRRSRARVHRGSRCARPARRGRSSRRAPRWESRSARSRCAAAPGAGRRRARGCPRRSRAAG